MQGTLVSKGTETLHGPPLPSGTLRLPRDFLRPPAPDLVSRPREKRRERLHPLEAAPETRPRRAGCGEIVDAGSEVSDRVVGHHRVQRRSQATKGRRRVPGLGDFQAAVKGQLSVLVAKTVESKAREHGQRLAVIEAKGRVRTVEPSLPSAPAAPRPCPPSSRCLHTQKSVVSRQVKSKSAKRSQRTHETCRPG